jgi:hypothetical protein
VTARLLVSLGVIGCAEPGIEADNYGQRRTFAAIKAQEGYQNWLIVLFTGRLCGEYATFTFSGRARVPEYLLIEGRATHGRADTLHCEGAARPGQSRWSYDIEPQGGRSAWHHLRDAIWLRTRSKAKRE